MKRTLGNQRQTLALSFWESIYGKPLQKKRIFQRRSSNNPASCWSKKTEEEVSDWVALTLAHPETPPPPYQGPLESLYIARSRAPVGREGWQCVAQGLEPEGPPIEVSELPPPVLGPRPRDEPIWPATPLGVSPSPP